MGGEGSSLVRGADVGGVSGEPAGAVVGERRDEHDGQQCGAEGSRERRSADRADGVGRAEASNCAAQANAARALAFLREGLGSLILHNASSIVGASTQSFERGYP